MSIRFKVCPELSDGVSWSIVDDKDILLKIIGEWIDEFGSQIAGETIWIETVDMTDEEVADLPEL